MRTPLIAANFKMNKNLDEAFNYFNELKKLTADTKNVEIVVATPHLLLYPLTQSIKNTNIQLSAQNVHWEDSGAFTAETSPKTLKAIGINYTILGHSERRKMFCETDETVNKRIKNALKNNLKIIFCIGESLDQRENNETIKVITEQVKKGLKSVSKEEMNNISIAYEPIWAIGTGKTATPEQAQEVHKKIREILNDIYGNEISQKTRILYGGSVKPNNIKDLISQNDIDGALVGGASLKAESFFEIISQSSK